MFLWQPWLRENKESRTLPGTSNPNFRNTFSIRLYNIQLCILLLKKNELYIFLYISAAGAHNLYSCSKSYNYKGPALGFIPCCHHLII